MSNYNTSPVPPPALKGAVTKVLTRLTGPERRKGMAKNTISRNHAKKLAFVPADDVG